jgi:hypothetical protein
MRLPGAERILESKIRAVKTYGIGVSPHIEPLGKGFTKGDRVLDRPDSGQEFRGVTADSQARRLFIVACAKQNCDQQRKTE